MKTEREIELEKQVSSLMESLRKVVKAWKFDADQGDGFNELDVAVYQEVRAALADMSLGADWVPRAQLDAESNRAEEAIEVQFDMLRALGWKGMEGSIGSCLVEAERMAATHQAELRRIAEAVLDRVFDLLSNACLFEEHQGIAVARRYVNDVRRDLDAIVKGATR